MTKIRKTPKLPGPVSTESSTELLAAPGSTSPIRELYEQPEFRLAWDNDLHLQIALAVGRLRHYRGLTQTQLAEAAGTTQSRIARIEGAGQNLTLQALIRIVEALDGRLRFAIEPSELHIPRMLPWWECLAQGLAVSHPCQWRSQAVVSNHEVTGRPTAAIAGWQTNEFAKELPDRLTTRASAQLSATNPDSEIVFSRGSTETENVLLKAWR